MYKEVDSGSDPDSELDEDTKPAAVENPVEMDTQRLELVDKCVSKAVSVNSKEMDRIMDHGIHQFPTKEIDRYLEIVEAAVPKAFYNKLSIANMDNVKSNLISGADARVGLRQMVNICVAVVDLFCTCKIDMFTGQSLGITQWIQVAMSKSLFRNPEESPGVVRVLTNRLFLHFSLLYIGLLY